MFFVCLFVFCFFFLGGGGGVKNVSKSKSCPCKDWKQESPKIQALYKSS